MISRRPHRAAVIGIGFVGAQHVEALRRIGTDVVVVAASDERRAEAAAAALGVPRSTGDWVSAASDSSVDVVHVCVPNDLHREVVLAALRSNHHVVCEKPLGMDVPQCRELVAAAEGTDRVTVLCHNYRFFPMVAELRARIRAGDLGRLHALRGAYLQEWLLSPRATNWRVDRSRGGRSRAIADIGTHWVDLAETVTGRMLSAVMADVTTVHTRRPAFADRTTFSDGSGETQVGTVEVVNEDQAGLLLRFDGDVRGTLTVSQVAAGHGNDLELSADGSGGSATWRQAVPDELWLSSRGIVQTVSRAPDRLSPGARGLARLPAGHNEGWADALRNLLAAAYGQIDGGRSDSEAAVAPLPTFRDGLRHLAFVEAALCSAAEGRWVAIDEALAQVPVGGGR